MLSALLLSRGVPPDVARSVIDELDSDEALHDPDRRDVSQGADRSDL